MNGLYHRLYLAGYHGRIMPKMLRHLIAGSEFHRAWFLGHTGHFEQGGIKFGLANPYGLLMAQDG